MRLLSKLHWPLLVPFLALCGMVVLLRFTHAEQSASETNPVPDAEEQRPSLTGNQQYLLQAVETNDWKTAAELLREGVDPNLRRPILWPHDEKPEKDVRMYNTGDTLLKIAVSARDEAMVRLLLRQGADVNAPGRFGYTPLMVAADTNETRLVKLLLQHGADPTAIGASRGESALHLVAMGVLTQVRRPNPERATSPEIRKEFERLDALYRSVLDKRIAIIKMLVAVGADPTLKDANGFSPADYARKRRDRELEEFLSSLQLTQNPTLAEGARR